MKLIEYKVKHSVTEMDYVKSIGLLSFLLLLSSCEKFVEVDLPTSKFSSETVFSSDVTATSAITGIYNDMLNYESYSSGSPISISSLAGVSSDELVDYGGWDYNNIEFSSNEITPINDYTLSLWASLYKTIYEANAAIEGLNSSSSLTRGTKDQLLGESLFIRAFANFYLVNLFGDVPIITSTDFRTNAIQSRKAIDEVYNQILSDLLESYELIGEIYVTSGRVRPNKYTVAALLSRVYMFQENWVEAEKYASSIIVNPLYGLPALNEVFLKNSKEAIWQLQPVNPDFNTNEGLYFVVQYWPDYNVIRTDLKDSFESGDDRLNTWVGIFDTGSEIVYFPYKYKVVDYRAPLSEYSMVFRLAEQYLIRAEARARQGNIIGLNSAESDVNVIRNRAGLLATTANTLPDMLTAIEIERRHELFTEWGHRWLDLKRWEKADQVLSTLKGSVWQATDVFYPIHQSEFDKNPNL